MRTLVHLLVVLNVGVEIPVLIDEGVCVAVTQREGPVTAERGDELGLD